MQISMNQGTGLSERNWLTEGCHPCAWKMMDPIWKLLFVSLFFLYTSSQTYTHTHTQTHTHTLHHLLRRWLLNKVAHLWLCWQKASGVVKLALYWLFHLTVRGPAEDLWDFLWWQDALTSWTFVFSSSFHFPYYAPRTSADWNQYLWTHKQTTRAFQILDFWIWIGQFTVFLSTRSMVGLDLKAEGKT